MEVTRMEKSEIKDKLLEIIEEELGYEEDELLDDINLLKPEEIKAFLDDYVIGQERAKKVLGLYLSDFSEEELNYCVEGAYADGKFSSKDVAPVVKLHDNVNILELFKGPTCAFKDMALQILPYLLTTSTKKINLDKKVVILVATSGDTGKAALEGFKDVEGTEILVFYPEDGVSAMQKTLTLCFILAWHYPKRIILILMKNYCNS